MRRTASPFTKGRPRCLAKSPTVQYAFRPIPSLFCSYQEMGSAISCRKCSQIAAWLYHLPASVAYHLLASVTWHLKTSKTDQERKGADIYMYVGKTGDILCPVAALLAYSAVRGALPGPLFQLQDRTLDKRLLHTEVQGSF